MNTSRNLADRIKVTSSSLLLLLHGVQNPTLVRPKTLTLPSDKSYSIRSIVPTFN